MAELLTSEEARTVPLPRLNVFARRRRIAGYLTELTAGIEALEGLDQRVPKNRLFLVSVARDREVWLEHQEWLEQLKTVTKDQPEESWLTSKPPKTRAALEAVAGEYLDWQGTWVAANVPKSSVDVRETIKKQIMAEPAPAEVPSMSRLRAVAAEEGVICPEDLVVTLVRNGARQLLEAAEVVITE